VKCYEIFEDHRGFKFEKIGTGFSEEKNCWFVVLIDRNDKMFFLEKKYFDGQIGILGKKRLKRFTKIHP
jgi:hypothetical protein